MIAHQVYDSDPLRKRLRQRGIGTDLPAQEEGGARVGALSMAPDRRAYHRLGNYWRLVMRYDGSLQIYRAFFVAMTLRFYSLPAPRLSLTTFSQTLHSRQKDTM